MRYLFFVLPPLLFLYAIVFLFIGLKAMIKNKPSVINSKWLFVMIFFSVLPYAIHSTIDLFEYGFKGPFGLILSITPILFIVYVVFFYFIIKGYSIYCVNDIDFREAVISSLNNASVKFEEKMNKIELTELNNELSIAFTSWVGAGMIKLKNKKDKVIFINIIDGIKQFFKEKNIKAKKMLAIFYVIFGIFFIILGAGSAMLFYK
ncbi:MAG: hypothetical protein LBL05_07020 [Synergistaceae bacterium]|jgi:hypothetical protein|nr:hypothetical protein [Synergistaceae bacterium]